MGAHLGSVSGRNRVLDLGLGLGRAVKILIGLGLNPGTDTEHRAVSVHLQACLYLGMTALVPT